MRFFIALEVPENSRQELTQLQQALKKLIPEARLTDNDKLHITIAFIGEQPDTLKDSLIKILKDAALGIKAFEVTPAYFDGFPVIHNPHTLWVGVKGDVDKLIIITERIRDGLSDLGLPVDQRRFVPHIAIAKTSNFHLSDSTEQQLQVLISKPLSPITVSSIKLFESVADEGFHKHNTLAEIPLEG